jgi:hypothetical protein
MTAKRKNTHQHQYKVQNLEFSSFNDAAGAAVSKSLASGEEIAIEVIDSRGRFLSYIVVQAANSQD